MICIRGPTPSGWGPTTHVYKLPLLRRTPLSLIHLFELGLPPALITLVLVKAPHFTFLTLIIKNLY